MAAVEAEIFSQNLRTNANRSLRGKKGWGASRAREGDGYDFYASSDSDSSGGRQDSESGVVGNDKGMVESSSSDSDDDSTYR